jgi:hypothetical protein
LGDPTFYTVLKHEVTPSYVCPQHTFRLSDKDLDDPNEDCAMVVVDPSSRAYYLLHWRGDWYAVELLYCHGIGKGVGGGTETSYRGAKIENGPTIASRSTSHRQ